MAVNVELVVEVVGTLVVIINVEITVVLGAVIVDVNVDVVGALVVTTKV